jgi:hypothetical protein
MLTAWGFASAFGPLLIAYMRQANGAYRGALHVIALVMALSTLLPIIVSPPKRLSVLAVSGDAVGEERERPSNVARRPAA